jgi:hypothetical protein
MAKKNLLNLLGETKEMEESKETGICCLFSVVAKAQIEAKITHLLQKNKTLATHNAMGMFYDGIGDLLDTLVETYMGLYPIEELEIEDCYCIKDPITYFQSLYNAIEKERTSIKESFLQNQIDTIQELVSHTLYRLKNIVT